MLQPNFKIAMFNALGIGPYHDPATVSSRASEWLVVERRGRILFISDGNIPADKSAASDGSPAPDTLMPNNSLTGLLIESDLSHGEDVFLLIRNLPSGISTPGNFFPGDGYARLSLGTNGLRLLVHGRHYHSAEVRNGAQILVDGGVPGSNGSAINWHFDAVQRPWSAQII